MKAAKRFSRSAGIVLSLALITAGCSGYSTPLATDAEVALVYPAQDGRLTDDGRKAPRGSPANPPRPKDAGTEVTDADGSGVGLSGAGVPGTIASPPPPGGWPMARLFSSDEDQIGIEDDRLRICWHAPIVFGQALGFDAEDFNVYWDMVNAGGGIFGRRVEVFVEDDANNPTAAVQAAERCRDRGSFLMLGGGAEATPAVRDWAEDRHMLYLPGLATERGTEGLRYSFSRVASIERLCRILARRVIDDYQGRNVAVVYRNNSSWIGGRDAFKAELAKANRTLVADIPIDDSTQTYAAQIEEMKRAGAEVVLVQDTTVRWIAMMRQAAAQGFRPQWMSWSGVALVGDIGGNDAVGAESVSPMVPYLPEADVPWLAEMERMQRAYARYHGRDRTPNDMGWVFWLVGRDLHRTLLDCGPDCTRNRLAGMLLSGYQGGTRWMCEPGKDLGRWSGHKANLLKLHRAGGSGSPRWTVIDRCRSGL